ncbi:MAG: hypothetical protein ACOY16_01140 [Chloroflexota bacterium]
MGERHWAGAAQVFYGSSSGITASGSWFFHPGLPEIEGFAETGDHFGMSLVAIPRISYWVFMPLILK